jgi:hypothetical protein
VNHPGSLELLCRARALVASFGGGHQTRFAGGRLVTVFGSAPFECAPSEHAPSEHAPSQAAHVHVRMRGPLGKTVRRRWARDVATADALDDICRNFGEPRGNVAVVRPASAHLPPFMQDLAGQEIVVAVKVKTLGADFDAKSIPTRLLPLVTAAREVSDAQYLKEPGAWWMPRWLTRSPPAQLADKIWKLSWLRHPAVVRLEAVVVENDVLSFVMEKCANRSLREYREVMALSDLEMWVIAVGMAEGLRYVHSQGFRHGSFSAERVLLDENLRPKLAGFGERGKTLECDICAFGRVLFELVTGARSPPRVHEMTAGERYSFLATNDAITQCMQVLLLSCWDAPGLRPSAAALVQALVQGQETLLGDPVSQPAFFRAIDGLTAIELEFRFEQKARKRTCHTYETIAALREWAEREFDTPGLTFFVDGEIVATETRFWARDLGGAVRVIRRDRSAIRVESGAERREFSVPEFAAFCARNRVPLFHETTLADAIVAEIDYPYVLVCEDAIDIRFEIDDMDAATELAVRAELPLRLARLEKQILHEIGRYFDTPVFYGVMKIDVRGREVTDARVGFLRNNVASVRFFCGDSRERARIVEAELVNGEAVSCVSFGPLTECANCEHPGGFHHSWPHEANDWFFYTVYGLPGPTQFIARTHSNESDLLRICEACRQDFFWFSEDSDPRIQLSRLGGSLENPAEVTLRNAMLVRIVLPTKATISVYLPRDCDREVCAAQFVNHYLAKTTGCEPVLTVKVDETDTSRYHARLPASGILRSSSPSAICFVGPDELRIDWKWPLRTLADDAIKDIAAIVGQPLDRLLFRSAGIGRPIQLKLLPRTYRYIRELARQAVELFSS